MADDLEASIRAVEGWSDGAARERVRALLRDVLALHAEGLSALVEGLREQAPGLLERLAHDPRVAAVLALHGRHPAPLHERVERALSDARPAIAAHGGELQLVSAEGSTVRVRFAGACSECAALPSTLKELVERSILALAPEVDAVEIA